jgi:hypothetical protein
MKETSSRPRQTRPKGRARRAWAASQTTRGSRKRRADSAAGTANKKAGRATDKVKRALVLSGHPRARELGDGLRVARCRPLFPGALPAHLWEATTPMSTKHRLMLGLGAQRALVVSDVSLAQRASSPPKRSPAASSTPSSSAMERSSSTRRCARRIPISTGWVEYGQRLRLKVTDWVVAPRRDSPPAECWSSPRPSPSLGSLGARHVAAARGVVARSLLGRGGGGGRVPRRRF